MYTCTALYCTGIQKILGIIDCTILYRNRCTEPVLSKMISLPEGLAPTLDSQSLGQWSEQNILFEKNLSNYLRNSKDLWEISCDINDIYGSGLWNSLWAHLEGCPHVWQPHGHQVVVRDCARAGLVVFWIIIGQKASLLHAVGLPENESFNVFTLFKRD